MSSPSGNPYRALNLAQSKLSEEEYKKFLLSLMTPSPEELHQLEVFSKAKTYLEAEIPGLDMIKATVPELFAVLAWIENKPGNDVLTLPKEDYEFVVEMIRSRIRM